MSSVLEAPHDVDLVRFERLHLHAYRFRVSQSSTPPSSSFPSMSSANYSSSSLLVIFFSVIAFYAPITLILLFLGKHFDRIGSSMNVSRRSWESKEFALFSNASIILWLSLPIRLSWSTTFMRSSVFVSAHNLVGPSCRCTYLHLR
jgi:hypothetical protein